MLWKGAGRSPNLRSWTIWSLVLTSTAGPTLGHARVLISL